MVLTRLGAIIDRTIRTSLLRDYFGSVGIVDVVLDLGCGERPYRHIYDPHCRKSIGADLPGAPFAQQSVDIECFATDVPLPDGSVDVILCSEVMQDIREPADLARETWRLLRHGGTLVLTTPFMVPIADGEYDHYRFTEHGLRYILGKQGFAIRRIETVGDNFGTLTAFFIKPQLKVWNFIAKGIRLPLIYSLWNPFIFVFVFIPQALYLGLYYLGRRLPPLRRALRKFSHGPLGYVVIADKPRD